MAAKKKTTKAKASSKKVAKKPTAAARARAKTSAKTAAKTKVSAKAKAKPKAKRASAKPQAKRASAKPRAVAKPPRARAMPAPKAKAPAPKPAAPPRAPAPKRAAAPKTNGVALAPAAFEVVTIVQEEIFDAAPMDVYDALLDPAKHAAFTGSTATGEPVEGGVFTAWDGYIEGRHERLVPGARIVQLWRTTEFPPGHPDSRLELELRPEAEGKTRLRMTHSGVPREQAKSYEQGWVEHYWEPLRDYLRDSAW